MEPETPTASKRGGGPVTEAGKAISSGNARKHGSTAETLILPDESRSEFDELRAGLVAEYKPETSGQIRDVDNAAMALWRLERSTQRYDENEQRLFAQEPDDGKWTPEQWHALALQGRYRTTAELSYGRAIRYVEQFRRNQRQAQEAEFSQWERQEKLRLEGLKTTATVGKSEAQRDRTLGLAIIDQQKHEGKKALTSLQVQAAMRAESDSLPKLKGKPPKPWPLSQRIVLNVENPLVPFSVYPSNELMCVGLEGKKGDHPVLRVFEFRNGVPKEYEWLLKPDEWKVNEQVGQVLTADEWRNLVAYEAMRGDGQRVGIEVFEKWRDEREKEENGDGGEDDTRK